MYVKGKSDKFLATLESVINCKDREKPMFLILQFRLRRAQYKVYADKAERGNDDSGDNNDNSRVR